ncbi:reverse transcriptase domain-containing protein [Tanacetum coccineum]
MLKSLLYNKEKLLELENTPRNENCSAVILKKLPDKLGDPGKFLIPCGFSELKCKALADLGASINLIPFSVWKKLGLPELISTRMTLEQANRTICTPVGIARDVFVPVRKFTFPADFVIVDYEKIILRDGDERLILNMRHDTSSYSNKPKKESINMIDIHNVSHEAYLEDFGNPTPISEPVTKSSSSPTITSFKESELIWEEFEAYLASDSFPPGNDDPVDIFLEEFADELALITFPPGNDDLPFDIESDLIEIEYLLNNDPTKEMDSILENSVDEGNLADDLIDTISEMFTDEHALDYSSPPLWDDYDDELFDLETVNDNTYDDPFDFKEEKIKDAKLLIDELDPPRSSIFLPSPECDSVFYWGEESDLIWEEFEAYLASDSFPPGNDDHVNLLLEEFADELALITFPPGNDDLPFDIESDLREIEYLLNNDPTKEMDSILEDSVDEDNLADPNNDLSDNDDVYDDPFDSKEDKTKESKLLIDELDPPRSSDFLPSPNCDSVLYEDFFEVDALPLTNDEDKVFNPGILIHENLFKVTIRVTNCAKNVKKTTNASLILEDFNPPLYELPLHKEVLGSETLLSFLL